MLDFDCCPVNPHTFNYNIIAKINNGPVKHFFYKDDCYYERYLDIEKGVKELLKNLYERDFYLEIDVLPNVKDNKDKYVGLKLVNIGNIIDEFVIKY